MNGFEDVFVLDADGQAHAAGLGLKHLAEGIAIDGCYGIGTSQALKNGNVPMASILNLRQSTFRNYNTAIFYPLKKLQRHSLTMLVGEEFVKKQESYNQSESRYFPEYLNAEQCLANMSLGTPQPSNSSVLPDDVILSYFGNAKYS